VHDRRELRTGEVAEEREPGERVDELLASCHGVSILDRPPADGGRRATRMVPDAGTDRKRDAQLTTI
jgi:hypothetical protein